MGTMILLTQTDGDKRIPWDPTDPQQVAEAKTRFDELTSQGYRCYSVARKGQRGERITEFDPTAGEILVTNKHGYVGG